MITERTLGIICGELQASAFMIASGFMFTTGHPAWGGGFMGFTVWALYVINRAVKS
jgi:hypothetical protein